MARSKRPRLLPAAMRKCAWPLVAAALALSAPHAAMACGICVEDKVAATYDFEVVAKATKNGHVVLFFDIVGALPQDAATAEAIRSAAAQVAGAERGTVRVSLQPPALSLVADTRRHAPAALQKRIEKKLAARKLRLKLLKTIEHGKLMAPG